MRVQLRDQHRHPVGSVKLKPGDHPHEVTVDGTKGEQTVPLQWENATDESGRIVRCLACGCRELFFRKDFPQKLGLTLVIAAAAVSVVLFALDDVLASMGVLAAAVIVDSLIFSLTPKCVVCYRCRTEYHGLEITPTIEPWELAIGEKYRPVRMEHAESRPASESTSISETAA